MFIIRRLLAKAYSLLPRSTTIPEACYDICNDAYLTAQKGGKTSEICASNSTFMIYIKACEQCDKDNEGNSTDLVPTLEQWLDYCSAVNPVPTSGNALNLSYSLVPTVIPDTVTSNGILTTWFFTTSITVLPPVPSTTVVQIPQTINGHLTTFTFTTTYANLPTGGAEVTNDTSIPSPTYNPETTASTNHAWIAGPVVGAVAGISIIVLGSFFLWRYKRKRLQTSTELESHRMPEIKSELDAPNRPQELDVSNPRTTEANEIHELATNG
ncbi:hypothetical protein F4805DRAFT_450397 [Annulohypoxylon moriforme]|nr:hypothetical protein F4805DRAFT_450397 [Annulohypoxylon moriforme]